MQRLIQLVVVLCLSLSGLIQILEANHCPAATHKRWGCNRKTNYRRILTTYYEHEHGNKCALKFKLYHIPCGQKCPSERIVEKSQCENKRQRIYYEFWEQKKGVKHRSCKKVKHVIHRVCDPAKERKKLKQQGKCPDRKEKISNCKNNYRRVITKTYKEKNGKCHSLIRIKNEPCARFAGLGVGCPGKQTHEYGVCKKNGFRHVSIYVFERNKHRRCVQVKHSRLALCKLQKCKPTKVIGGKCIRNKIVKTIIHYRRKRKQGPCKSSITREVRKCDSRHPNRCGVERIVEHSPCSKYGKQSTLVEHWIRVKGKCKLHKVFFRHKCGALTVQKKKHSKCPNTKYMEHKCNKSSNTRNVVQVVYNVMKGNKNKCKSTIRLLSEPCSKLERSKKCPRHTTFEKGPCNLGNKKFRRVTTYFFQRNKIGVCKENKKTKLESCTVKPKIEKITKKSP